MLLEPRRAQLLGGDRRGRRHVRRGRLGCGSSSRCPRARLTTTADLPAPRVDDDSLAVLNDAIDTLRRRRTVYWLGDTSVHLHALASLPRKPNDFYPTLSTTPANKNSPGLIGQLLNLAPSTAARRFRNNP